jgi:6-phosphogluconolactonase
MKKQFLFFVLSILLFGQVEAQVRTDYTFYIGTYTSGESKGIYKYILQGNGLMEYAGLAARSENPSYLTFNKEKEFLLAVNENKAGRIESFAVTNDTLLLVSKSPSGGSSPCYVTTNGTGYILTANYGSGTVGLLKMNSGQLSKLQFVEDHHSEEGLTAHAHSVQFIPNSNTVISVDLGTNELWFSKLDTTKQKLIPLNQPRLKLSGNPAPRHFVQHPNGKWIYVINELGNSVTLVKHTPEGAFIQGETFSTLPADFKGKSYCADIHLSADNRFIYASNRGFNSIAIFKVNTDGSIKLIDNEPVRGDFPRNFALSPDENYLLVANQKSNNIVAFKRDKTSGLLQFVDEIDAPVPVYILF